ncbi:MAG: hypothetical protein E7074_07035 [Bacteroidales bacterium]|nr:hypothetical protein [Bacteroidales bacterium]
MSMSTSQIKYLKVLLEGGTLAWSALSNDIRQNLIKEEQIVVITHGSRKTIYTPNPDCLRQFLEHNYEELRGFNWDSESSSATSRAELAARSGNSKTQTIRSCPGFMVNSYSPIYAKLNGKEIVIAPEEGSMLFIADWHNFVIPEDVIVVGIENMENFRLIREQKYLFLKNKRILFVSRYPQSTDLREWLFNIPNTYIHFGDFDLAGLHIYETEFYKYLGARASFLIPEDIDIRIRNGSIKRYNDQYQKFKNYTPSDERLLPLFNTINRYHRCYDQEGYIKNEIQQQNIIQP